MYCQYIFAFYTYNNIMKKQNNTTIILTGGGTAGHVMPNLALLPELKKYYDKIYYLGTDDGIEKQILKNYSEITFISIPAVKFRRTFSLKTLSIPFKLISSINQTKKIIKEINPDVIFSKGGYVSIPVCIASKKLHIPVISHESDLTMGLANKVIYKFCDCMCTGFEKTACKRKMIFTGSPIRPEILNGNKNNILNIVNIDKNKKTVMFFGGSIGATAINKLVWTNINSLCSKYNVIHIVGKNNLNKSISNKNYLQVEFVNNIQDYYDLADICISRSGANSIFELLAIKKPALFIPLPKLESRGDQIDNAQYFKNLGYCNVLFQEEATNKKFLEMINLTMTNKDKIISNMNKSHFENPNKKIVEIINKYANIK